ncbi:piggyBac transposable element-derived protein 4-like [Macrobrachium rosenbergii]|uniref:piggyBac transposable element-derived protein 4-like n=1 Tax=Macrobrachium rosenbergii TaxID=79674 RepID=UPI0034D5BE43
MPGLNVPTPTTILGFLQLFITRELLVYLAAETNAYAYYMRKEMCRGDKGSWVPVTVQEMAIFLGLIIIMGIFPAPERRMCWQTERNVSLDEGLMPYKGRLSIKTYNPQKPSKYGIKLYMLCEAKSGYVIDFLTYGGSTSTLKDIVFTLMGPLLDKGYHVFMDNYYNSIE